MFLLRTFNDDSIVCNILSIGYLSNFKLNNISSNTLNKIGKPVITGISILFNDSKLKSDNNDIKSVVIVLLYSYILFIRKKY